MTAETREQVKLQLMRHEGTGPMKRGRLYPYQDTVGKWTIGHGRNLSDRGISPDEAMFLLENDLDGAIRDCVVTWPWFATEDPVRQRALVDLVFNMGVTKVLTFKNTLKYWAAGEHVQAAINLRKSEWFRQVGTQPGQRGYRVTYMLETGKDV